MSQLPFSPLTHRELITRYERAAMDCVNRLTHYERYPGCGSLDDDVQRALESARRYNAYLDAALLRIEVA